ASSASGTYGEFILNADGSWSYVVDNAAAQGLNDGEVEFDSFTIETLDGTTSTVTIAISGSDEATNNIQLIDGELIIIGTDGDDNITVIVDNGQIVITSDTFPGATFDVGDVDIIDISAGDGDDNVTLTNSVQIPALIDGGDGNDNLSGGRGGDIILGGLGNDTIRGRRGSDILLGGDGVDTLRGNNGRDLLLGGDDADNLIGGNGDDLMLGGITIYDGGDFDSLNLLRDAWNTNRSFNQRTFDVRFGLGPILAGTGVRLLINDTIFSDGDDDFANGGNGLDLLL
ncbi:MAG: VCBS domain-containing protein, partial [Planctomycetota bacterium]